MSYDFRKLKNGRIFKMETKFFEFVREIQLLGTWSLRFDKLADFYPNKKLSAIYSILSNGWQIVWSWRRWSITIKRRIV